MSLIGGEIIFGRDEPEISVIGQKQWHSNYAIINAFNW